MAKSKVSIYTVGSNLKQEERIDHALKLLELEGMRSTFHTLAQKNITSAKQNPYDFLESLLEKELFLKEENRRLRWIQQAHFPCKKTLNGFDFSFQPSIDKRQIFDLASGRYISQKVNVFFLGPSGVGKTHLSIALGLEAIEKGYDVKFLTLRDFIEAIDKNYDTEDGEKLVRFSSSLLRPKLLILDEMDLYDINPIASALLFKLLYDRYEKGSIIFTSNRSFTEWSKLFGNATKANTILDRITHHRLIINIKGESYRLNS